ncbi:MAG TPA: hypothetical protein VKP30_24710 [Polyangiaceae bacterium]|nr:hypothetical protein [Polyangiaceae bacterium]
MRFVTLSCFTGLVMLACSPDEASNIQQSPGESIGATGGADTSSSRSSLKGGQSGKGGASSGGTRTASSTKTKGGASSTTGGADDSSSAPDAGGSSTKGGTKNSSDTKSSAGGSGNSSGSKPTSGGTTTGTKSSTAGGTANTKTSSNAGGQDQGGSATGGGLATGPQTTCGDTATTSGTNSSRDTTTEILVEGRDKNYTVLPNWWKKYDGQSIAYKGLSFTVSDPKNVASGADTDPTGYPTLFIGQYAGAVSKGSNLPKQVSALTTIPTIFSTNALSRDNSQFNAAYDVWFTAGSAPIPSGQFNPGSGGAYLMVWYYKPNGRQPRGGVCGGGGGCQPNQKGHSVAGVSPGSWDVWIDNTNPPCISYVSTSPIDSMTFDLNKFIQDAVNNSYGIKKEMYLSLIFAGFEIWGGGNGLEVKQFCAHVN